MGSIVSGIGDALGGAAKAVGGAAQTVYAPYTKMGIGGGGGMGGIFNALTGQTGYAVPTVEDPTKVTQNQQQLVQALQAQMAGKSAVPSAAAQMLQQQAQQNNNAIMAQAAAARGINPALAMRNAQLAGTQMQQQAAGQAGVQRSREQLEQTLGAQQQLGNIYNQQQGHNLQAQAINAGIQQGNAQREGNFFGGILGAGGNLISSILAGGGKVGTDGMTRMADGGTPTTVYPSDTYMPLNPGEGGTFANATVVNPMGGQDSSYLNPFSGLGVGQGSTGSNAGSEDPLALFRGISGEGDNSMGIKSGKGGGGGGGGAGLLALLADGGSPENGPQSFVGRHLKMSKGGKVPSLVSPGEQYLNPEQAREVAQGKKHAMNTGEKIPGKPKVGGAVNSYDNDTVPKMLEKGGVVVPRKITQDPEAAKKADAFVKAVLSRKGK